MSTEDNTAASRRFYEEVINQKQLAAVDEVTGDLYHSHDFPPGLPPGREVLLRHLLSVEFYLQS
jgi:hypothetical protein